MMYVPAGEFVMGSKNGLGDEMPAHTVYLDAYYIDRFPVTNAEYKKFVEAAGHRPPAHWKNGAIPAGQETHPVVNVSWYDAAAYAQWAGKRLPTEAEWEKAASWDFIKREKRVYPWGNRFDPARCNSKESGIGTTTPVGKYSPQGDSPYGVADLAGNVWEWVADWYDKNYYANSPSSNPLGPSSGISRVLRGGAWVSSEGNVCSASRSLNSPDVIDVNIGFRCVRGTSP
jgi:formylglycine-generating enzyme required for sulfatase activity